MIAASGSGVSSMAETMAEELLAPFAALVGDWTTQATHVALSGTLHGRVRFEWLAGERFLLQHAATDHPDVPDALSVIGVMEGDQHLSMQYFDSRGVHRIYRIAFDGTELWIWRDAPGFAQRSTARLSSDGLSLEGVWELNEKDQGFRHDMTISYRRVG